MIAPYKITWQGLSSLEFDVWTGLAFDEEDGDVDSHLSREAIVSEAYNGVLKRAHSYRWDNDFITTVTFMKQNYSDFTPEENRKILKWLTGSKNASFLEVYKDNSEVAEYYILGNWINVSQYKLGNGRVVGYIAEFESLTPWAFSDIQSVTKEITSPENNTISLYVETDEPQDLIYPRITIEQDNNTYVVKINQEIEVNDMLWGTVYEYNNTYYWLDTEGAKQTSTTKPTDISTTSVVMTNKDENGREIISKISNNILGEKITIDGANRVISSDRSNGRIFGDDFDWNWLGLAEGENTLSVIGNCTITVEWREPIKYGEW